MSNKRRHVLLNAWVPAAICVFLIGVSSSDSFSSDNTSSFLRPLLERLFGAFSDPRWAFVLFAIRKVGHFFVYGFVSVVFFRAWRMTFRLKHTGPAITASLRAVAAALLSTLVVSSLDEFHQSFLPKRTGSPFDVLLDMCGAVTCHLIVFSVYGGLLELSITTRPDAE